MAHRHGDEKKSNGAPSGRAVDGGHEQANHGGHAGGEGHEHGHAHPGGGLGHHHHHLGGGGDDPQRSLLRAMGVTFLFMAIEAVGGWYSNSLALASDAAHMLTDIGAMCLSLFAIWMARRPSNEQMSFGYHRAEILGALASGLIIWLISGMLVFEAVTRFRAPPEVNGPVVLIVSAIGLAANLFSMRMLLSTKDGNMNVRAAYVHMISDALGSVGAVVAGAVLWATGWRPIDPIITVLFALLMLYSSWSLVKEAVGILMESTPQNVDAARVRADLASLPGVQEVHDLHIWAVTNQRAALSVHLIASDSGALLAAANQLLKEKHRIQHTTIQIEPPGGFESDRCYDCGP